MLPDCPYRHFTLSLPWQIRPRLARDRRLLNFTLSAFVRTVFNYQRRRARKAGIKDPLVGACTFIHRADSILRLNMHFHSFFPDGVFYKTASETIAFYELPPPDDDDILKLTQRIATRVTNLCQRPEDPPKDEDLVMAHSVGEAAAPLSQPRLPGVPLTIATTSKPRCAHVGGFSLHANSSTAQCDRAGLERMLRYGARPALAQSRLSLRADGRVVYKLRRRYYDGRTEIVMDPEAFVKRLCALIPPPWLHMTRHHGVFASASKHRKAVLALVPRKDPPTTETTCTAVPQMATHAQDGAEKEDTPRPALPLGLRIRWAELLRRTMGIEALACPRCHRTMRPIALINEKPVITKILRCLGLPTEPPPVASARAPPQTEFEGFDDIVDDAFA